MKNNRLIFSYLFFQLLLYIIILVFDLPQIDYIRYFIILLNFIMSIIILIKNKTKDSLIITLAMMFTSISDYNLVLINKNYNLSIILFIFTQCLYGLRIYKNISIKLNIIVRIIILIIFELLTFIILKNILTLIIILAILYISISITNIFISFFNNNNYIFSFGLIMLFICDIFVGIRNSCLMLINSNTINYLIWLFYVPSQVLIVLSSYYKKNIKCL